MATAEAQPQAASDECLLAAVLAKQVICLLLRTLMSQMDVPARQSFVMSVVATEERTAASSVTNVPRSLAAAMTPLLAGLMLEHSSFGWPLIVGGAMFSIVFYPANWPLLAPFRLVVEHMGQLATVADVIGYTFTRTSMPEYLRIIERGTLRSFGENPAVVSALFSGFLSVIMYGAWYTIGTKLSELPRMKNAYSRYMGIAA